MRGRLLTAVAVVGLLSGCALFDRDPRPSLADRFPDTLGGEPFEVDTDVGTGSSSETDIIPDLGVELGDVVVVACPGDPREGDGELSCIAYQYTGVDERLLAETYIRRLREQGDVLEDGWRGGRRGWVRDDGVLGDTFIFTRHDALYILNGDEDLMDELVAAIP